MATNPNDLLLAAGIFGNGQLSPQALALLKLAQSQQQSPFINRPTVAPPPPVPVAQQGMPTPQTALPADTGNPFAFWSAPQAHNEPYMAYDFRHAVGAPFRAVDRGVKDVASGIRSGLSTPDETTAAAATQQHPTGGSAFPASYADPEYDRLEAAYASGAGNPTLADALAKLRTLGERSNAGQVSSAGAQTPYQITPETRAAIMKQHGFDPWSSPANAVRGAVLAATAYTGMQANYNDPAVMARAAGGYFAGKAGADNPFGAASDGNNTTLQYVSRVLGQNLANPYDPSYDQKAAQALGAERKAAMTPFSISADAGPAPGMPKPEPVPQTDFTSADAALAAMHPVEMSAKEKLTRERDGFFKGIGEAMMRAPGNEGLGTLLMRIGGGALAGREGARDEIRAEQDKFDTEMSRYNAAVYSNELGKAETHAREAQAIIQQNNEYNMNNWKVAYDRWTKNSNIDISGTNAIKTTRDENGHTTVSVIPIAGAVDAAYAHNMASLFQHEGGMALAGNQQVASMTNAVIGRMAIQQMMGSSGSSAESDASAAAAPAFYGTFIASHGLTSDLIGPDGAKSLEESVIKQLQGMQMMPGSKEWIDRHDRLLATELTKLGMANPQMMRKMIQVGGSATSFNQMSRYYGRNERTSVDSKGMPSTSTTYDGNAADIFGGQ